MFVIEKPLHVAPAADSTENVLAEWNALYDAYNEVACLMLGCVRNYNMHNMRKTIGELHDMLIEYKKGLPKKTETPQEVGHWKRNCPVYLAELLKKQKLVDSASSSCIFTIFLTNPSNDIYEIDMHDLAPNVNSIYNVSTKRAKHNLDSTYLWHYHLAHIKRATDLLRIIHTDMCGLLRHVSRQGASYFITFTNDYSRYGYVYLLKHKHEVFETFKVFKNKVENQLGKTIKALRSDQGGEYISQEFNDYLKAYGIVQQFTPQYTPQHNDISERRNRSL
nr:retrotransposon protein, putative, Ty1-copia subclass [Tanacetum cinerariifolium]